MNQIDSDHFRRVLGHFPTGVTVIAASSPRGPVGMAVGSFSSVSLEPPLVAFFADRKSTTWPTIQETGGFVVNVLAHDQQHLCKRFATSGGDKFTALDYHRSPSGHPILDSVTAWIDCRLAHTEQMGDHFIAVGEVLCLDLAEGNDPLVFCRGELGRIAIAQGRA